MIVCRINKVNVSVELGFNDEIIYFVYLYFIFFFMFEDGTIIVFYFLC